MKITNPLDNILDNEAKVKILRFLLKSSAQWNGRQIAKEIGLAPATTHKALHALYKEGVLLLHNIGRAHLYSINDSSVIVKNMLSPLFAKEDKILDNIITVVKQRISSSKVGQSILSVALFGSVNVRDDHSRSDIDLAVVINNKKAKAATEHLFEGIDAKISKKFGNTLSPYINTKAEFRVKYKKGMAIIKSILKSYRILYGKRLETLL